MNRRFIFGAVIALLLLNLAVGAKIYTDTMRIRGQAASEDSRANLDLVEDVLHKIKYEYVDGTNLTYRQLVYSALKGAVSRLDPHSEFLDPESFHREAVEGFRERAAKAGGIGRLAAAVRGNRLRDQRAAIDARREETRRTGIREFLLDATIGSGAREAGTRGWLVCLDADDVLLGQAATEGDGLSLAPGGLR